MIVGITATREGLTEWQKTALRRQLALAQATVLHHGDCQGGDADAHEIALELGLSIIIHPPSNPSQRALCRGADITCVPKPYLQRNHDIVEACHILLAFPRTQREIQRSGTWATIRYARKVNKPHMIFAGDQRG